MKVRGLLDVVKREEKLHPSSALQTALPCTLLLDPLCAPYLDRQVALWDGPQLCQKSRLSPRQLGFLGEELEHMIHRVKVRC